MSRSEVYILCEGYHDRAFWAGWLDRLGCKNLGRGCVDPWGKSVTGGQFGFQSRAGRFVRVVPAGGKDEVRRLARIRLQGRATEPLKAVVASVDHDGIDNANVAEGPLNRESLASLANEIDAEAERVADNHFRIDGGSVDIAVVRWQSDGTHGESVPRQQTLERLCCSAILDAYGDRADPVRVVARVAPRRSARSRSQSVCLVTHGRVVCRAWLRRLLPGALARAPSRGGIGKALTRCRRLANRRVPVGIGAYLGTFPTGQRVSALRGSAAGDRQAGRCLRAGQAARLSIGRDRIGQDLYGGQRGRPAESPDAGHLPQQDARRPALRGVSRALSPQRRRVFRQLLRLLSTGSVHSPARHLHRKRRLAQRRSRSVAAARDQFAGIAA
jgi:hypothetical protein